MERCNLRQGSRTFPEWFEKATDFASYRYQIEFAERGAPPSVLEVPTRSGKTQAVLGTWLYRRLELETGPHRLVYALPIRALVEQTRDVAMEMRTKLGKSEEELPIHVLMGAEDLAGIGPFQPPDIAEARQGGASHPVCWLAFRWLAGLWTYRLSARREGEPASARNGRLPELVRAGYGKQPVTTRRWRWREPLMK
jgi:hypothetical protein